MIRHAAILLCAFAAGLALGTVLVAGVAAFG